MFTLETAYQWLLSLQTFGIKLGLANMRALTGQLDNPQRAVPCVHLAGTNGKGSTAAFLERILRQAGYKTGLYSSPHLERVNERFRINGQDLNDEAVAQAAWTVYQAEQAWNNTHDDEEIIHLTFFEATTLMAFVLFQQADVDIALYEVGMGGRLDATNIVEPVVSIITTLSLEHQQYLGDTLAAIASEKAGIIKPGVPVICARQQDEAQQVVQDKARQLNTPLERVGHEIQLSHDKGLRIDCEGQILANLRLSLAGEHQHENASLAVAAALRLRDAGFKLSDDVIRQGLQQTRWPGRLERFGSSPTILLDAAHNLGGMETLVRYLKAIRPEVEKLVCVFAVMQDKDYPPMIRLLAPQVDAWVATTVSSMPRALPASDLARTLQQTEKPITCREYIAEALKEARTQAGAEGLVLVCGSIFLLGEAMPHAKAYAEPS